MTDPLKIDFVVCKYLAERVKRKDIWLIHSCSLILLDADKRNAALDKLESRERASFESGIVNLELEAKMLGLDVKLLASALKESALDKGIAGTEPQTPN